MTYNLRPIIHIISYVVLSTMHYVCFTPLVHAQSTELSLSPPVIEALVAPNKSYSQVFQFKTTQNNVIVTPSIHKVIPTDDNGHSRLDPNPLNMDDLPVVVTSSPALGSRVHLAGHELPITLTISASNTDIPQDVYLALVLKVEPQAQLNISSLTTPAISALIFTTITPDGALPINLEVINFEPPSIHDSWLSLTFNPKIQNNTPFMIRPQGKFEIISPRGTVLTSFMLYPHLILGQTSRNVESLINDAPSTLTFHSNWRLIGPHKIRLTITSAGNTKLQEIEKTIWILPIRLFALIFLILVILYRLTSKPQNSTLDN